MTSCGLLVIGAGPAGLCAAIAAGEAGVSVMVLERSHVPGGQLVKQTHMFFGSEKQYASTRGMDIAQILLERIAGMQNVQIHLNSTVLGIYEDGIVTAEIDAQYVKLLPESIIVATGASEKSLPFSGNDLPGIYGAGAVQTLMNQFGVLPAENVVMLGAGNIGLIVSYQLLQAGVRVQAVVEGSAHIGGYSVHAAKLRRMGVPILTTCSVKEAHGTEQLDKVTVWQLDKTWQGIPGTEQEFVADALCVAVGLSPLAELLWQAGCEMTYVHALGGHVPLRDNNLRTTVQNIFIAGDVAGIEEASSAMVEGYLAGYSAAEQLGCPLPDHDVRVADCRSQLTALRSGHVGDKIRAGLAQTRIGKEGDADAEMHRYTYQNGYRLNIPR